MKNKKITSTPEDLEQWLMERNACPKDINKFKGLTFKKGWKIATISEKCWAIRELIDDGVIKLKICNLKNWQGFKKPCYSCTEKYWLKNLDPKTIGFIDD